MTHPTRTGHNVRPAAKHEWEALQRSLAHAADAGHTIPCHGISGELWTSEHADEREVAAEWCRRCPALRRCHDFAEANLEIAHVWGGHDHTTSKEGNR